MTRTFAALALLCLPAALADETLTYAELSDHRVDHQGKTVRFSFDFTRLSPTVQPLLAGRGITDESHLELATPPRPLREGGSLLLLAPRRNAKLVQALEALERGPILLAGTVRTLKADNGSSWYWVELSDVAPASGREDVDGGEARTGDPLEGQALLDDALAHDGQTVRVVVPFGGFDRLAPPWAYRLAGRRAEEVGALRGTDRFAILVPRSSDAAAGVLRGLAEGDRVVLEGTCEAEEALGRTRLVLVVASAERADE